MSSPIPSPPSRLLLPLSLPAPGNGAWVEAPDARGGWDVLWSWSRPPHGLHELFFWQRVNHFPQSRELTRKDLLVSTIPRPSFPLLSRSSTLPLLLPSFASSPPPGYVFAVRPCCGLSPYSCRCRRCECSYLLPSLSSRSAHGALLFFLLSSSAPLHALRAKLCPLKPPPQSRAPPPPPSPLPPIFHFSHSMPFLGSPRMRTQKKNLSRYTAAHPQQRPIVPETFILPFEYAQFLRAFFEVCSAPRACTPTAPNRLARHSSVCARNSSAPRCGLTKQGGGRRGTRKHSCANL